MSEPITNEQLDRIRETLEALLKGAGVVEDELTISDYGTNQPTHEMSTLTNEQLELILEEPDAYNELFVEIATQLLAARKRIAELESGINDLIPLPPAPLKHRPPKPSNGMSEKTAWVIYRPVMDYEESIEVHAVCPDFVEATSIVEQCLEFHFRLLARLPAASEDLADDEYEDERIRRDAIIKTARWPYGINTSEDIPYSGNTPSSGFLAVMEVPVVVRKVKTKGKR